MGKKNLAEQKSGKPVRDDPSQRVEVISLLFTLMAFQEAPAFEPPRQFQPVCSLASPRRTLDASVFAHLPIGHRNAPTVTMSRGDFLMMRDRSDPLFISILIIPGPGASSFQEGLCGARPKQQSN